ncbi:TonB-dependent receptor [Aliidongia dinghuensis]|uniref:TonB-dependent receptor n=1 Tax=Aliidongia dinghuensis TaxID=1867774 RepID=A0A8J2YR05_9PROT|nr:TonB-dependent receptor [Aliidongia dinghuensis]GGF05972.1 TonB-dependent receptor [Aliidongia dinghuensis]
MRGFRHGPATVRWTGLLSACSVSALALAAGLSGVVGLAGTARAQDATAQAGTQAGAQAAAPALEQIVVTAQHKPEYEKDVPLAVTSLDAQTVDNLTSSGDDIRFLAARVPSLNVESSFGRTYPRFYIRGLGNPDFTYNAQQPVSVVSDDVVLENPILKAFPVFDVQDVEVLRGPQGTLFGRNTPAGVVKIDTRKPNDDYSGYVDLSYGNWNTVNFSGAVGGAIVPNILDFRASVLEERRDDWVHNVNPNTPYHRDLEGYTDTAARLQLLYKPTDTLDALLEVDGRALDGTARLFRANIIQPGTNKLVDGFRVDRVDFDGDNYQNLGTWGTHLTVNNDFGPVTLTSVSAYEHGSVRSRGDIDGGNFSAAVGSPFLSPGSNLFSDETSDSIPGLDQFTQEVRLQTNGDGPFFNQGGFFYFHEYLRVDSFSYNTDGSTAVSMNQTQGTESFGVFDSATYKVTDDLKLGAGIRFSTDSKDYNVGCFIGCFNPLKPTLHTNSSDTTFDLSATYSVTPDMNVYGRIATGYLAPALDGRNVEFDGFSGPAPLSVAKAETTTSYEIGLKSNLLQHRANLNLTAYAWNTDNLQLAAIGGSTQGTNLLNAKSAIGEGFEAEFEFKPTEQWLLTASGSYNFTQIQDSSLEVSPCSACTVTSPIDPVTGNVKINHNPLPNAPRWVLDGTARYSIPLNRNNEVYVLTDWSYRSTENFFLYQSKEFTGQSLLLGGLRVGYVDRDRGLEFAAYVHNILDNVKVTGAIDFDNLTGFVNDPRTYGVEVRYRF